MRSLRHPQGERPGGPRHAAALATARKAGFVEEGTLRSAGLVYDGRVDLVVVSRLRSDPRPRFQGA